MEKSRMFDDFEANMNHRQNNNNGPNDRFKKSNNFHQYSENNRGNRGNRGGRGGRGSRGGRGGFKRNFDNRDENRGGRGGYKGGFQNDRGRNFRGNRGYQRDNYYRNDNRNNNNDDDFDSGNSNYRGGYYNNKQRRDYNNDDGYRGNNNDFNRDNFKDNNRNYNEENEKIFDPQKEKFNNFQKKYSSLIEQIKVIFINEIIDLDSITKILINITKQPGLTIFEVMNILYREIQIYKTLKNKYIKNYGPEADKIDDKYPRYFPINKELVSVIKYYKIYNKKDKKQKKVLDEEWFYNDSNDQRRPLKKNNEDCYNYLPLLKDNNEDSADNELYAKNENEILYHPLYYKTLLCKYCENAKNPEYFEENLCPFSHNIQLDFRIIYDYSNEEIQKLMKNLMESDFYNFENYLNFIPMNLNISEFDKFTFKVHKCQLDSSCPNDYHECPYAHSSIEETRRPILLFRYSGETGSDCFNEKKKQYCPEKCKNGIFCQYLHNKNEYNYHPDHFQKEFTCKREKKHGKCIFYRTCYGIHDDEDDETEENEEEEDEKEKVITEKEIDNTDEIKEVKKKIKGSLKALRNCLCKVCVKYVKNGEFCYFIDCQHFLCCDCFNKMVKKNRKKNKEEKQNKNEINGKTLLFCPYCEKEVKKGKVVKIKFEEMEKNNKEEE